MTLDTLGSRLGIGRSGMSKLETAEAKGAITLNRLRQAAEGLDCELVVLLVPKESLEGTVRRRARQSARRTLMPVRHSMVMESQPIKDAQMEAMVDELADDLIARADQSIWTEE